jgi:hypothetical protein
MPYCLAVPQTKALQYYLVVPLINASLSFCPKDHSPTLLLSLWLMSHCLGVPPTLHHCLVVPLKIAPLSLCPTNKWVAVLFSHWSMSIWLVSQINAPLIFVPLSYLPTDQIPTSQWKKLFWKIYEILLSSVNWIWQFCKTADLVAFLCV